jgi:YHS domain-containing protein
MKSLILLLSCCAGSLGVAQEPANPAPPAAKETPKPAVEDDGKDPDVKRDVSRFNLGKDGLAIDGHDPVAYFPEGGGKAQKGSEKITYRYRGVLYRFVSDDNKKRFTDDPSKYEPAYGGWCAYGMAKENKVEIDPESFLIEGSKLMLFFDGFLADTRAKWKDEGGAKLKPKADRYFESLAQK